MRLAAATPDTTQNIVTAIYIYVRLKVTTCLYLSPNSRARSLSTHIAVNVNKDTKPNA